MELARLTRFASLVALCILSSCTYGYEIDIALRHGKLIFRFDHGDPVSLESLRVLEISRQTEVVWDLSSANQRSLETGEVIYGRPPSGMSQVQPAKRLKYGQLYRVELETTDGGGLQEFVVSIEPGNPSDEAAIVRE